MNQLALDPFTGNKLNEAAEVLGYHSTLDMLMEEEDNTMVPGICVSPRCRYVTAVDIEQDEGFCEDCGTDTVASIFVIAEEG